MEICDGDRCGDGVLRPRAGFARLAVGVTAAAEAVSPRIKSDIRDMYMWLGSDTLRCRTHACGVERDHHANLLPDNSFQSRGGRVGADGRTFMLHYV